MRTQRPQLDAPLRHGHELRGGLVSCCHSTPLKKKSEEAEEKLTKTTTELEEYKKLPEKNTKEMEETKMLLKKLLSFHGNASSST